MPLRFRTTFSLWEKYSKIWMGTETTVSNLTRLYLFFGSGSMTRPVQLNQAVKMGKCSQRTAWICWPGWGVDLFNLQVVSWLIGNINWKKTQTEDFKRFGCHWMIFLMTQFRFRALVALLLLRILMGDGKLCCGQEAFYCVWLCGGINPRTRVNLSCRGIKPKISGEINRVTFHNHLNSPP